MFQLVWNDADPESETNSEKLIKANYATLKQAKEQAEHDVEMGKRIVGIADKDGKFVWTAEGHEDKKKLVRKDAVSYVWSVES